MVDWFDGAASGDRQRSGAGGVIQFDQKHIIKWTFNLGAGSNKIAVLIGVWTTLLLAKLLNIHSIQIIGDRVV
jgi:ribonuclease HI